MADDQRRIGFIGLGLMGQAFTRRLVACGYQVTGYDIRPQARGSAAHGVGRRARPPRSRGRAITSRSAS